MPSHAPPQTHVLYRTIAPPPIATHHARYCAAGSARGPRARKDAQADGGGRGGGAAESTEGVQLTDRSRV